MSANPSTLEQSAPERDVDAVRAELLKLLHRVGAEADTPRPAPPSEADTAKSNIAENAATAEAKLSQPASDGTVTTCPHCGSTEPWGRASWCPRCGYYPALGRAGEVTAGEDEDMPVSLRDVIPGWAGQLAGGLFVIITFSAALEWALRGHPGWLSLVSLVQLSFGGIVTLLAHRKAMLVGLNDPETPGFATLLLYPPAVWEPVLKQLKTHAPLFVSFCWGLTAVVSAAMIYGPIRLAEISRELAEMRRNKPAMMKSIVGAVTRAGSGTAEQGKNPADIGEALDQFAGGAEAAQGAGGGNGAGAASIDAAVEDFAGGAASVSGGPEGNQDDVSAKTSSNGPEDPAGKTVDPGTNRPQTVAQVKPPRGEQPKTPAQPGAESLPPTSGPRQLQVVVFGYLANSQGEVRVLLVAATGADGRPRFVGKIGEEALQPVDWSQVVGELPKLKTSRPLVACPFNGHWVQPRLVLTMDYDGRSLTSLADPQVREVQWR